MELKPVSVSAITDHVLEVFPEDSEEGVLGSRLMQTVDQLASSVAFRHSDMVCTVQGVDSRFHNPITPGEVLICRAAVNKVWGKSMEVEVDVMAENFRTLEQKPILSAYFTMGAAEEIVQVLPETEEEKERFYEAEQRRLSRIH